MLHLWENIVYKNLDQGCQINALRYFDFSITCLCKIYIANYIYFL